MDQIHGQDDAERSFGPNVLPFGLKGKRSLMIERKNMFPWNFMVVVGSPARKETVPGCGGEGNKEAFARATILCSPLVSGEWILAKYGIRVLSAHNFLRFD